ncbi:MAG: OmcA/MtrC family decaheme c-type cytochrome [Bryobacteraceae bacterium]|nr:OmcA/MtrC family decaheme c-type cytochrome [Bryobacteraceae bacterium]MDW8377589.1 OmcA/MtrC family decaheme c-type cytochrome [Bryobacterales bacterium]
MISFRPIPRSIRWTGVLITVILGAAILTSAPSSPFHFNEKAYYTDEKTLNFVRPGLAVRILSVDVAPDGTVRARVRFTDPRGVPLDREGIQTPGVISASFILARIPRDQSQYVAYTTRVQTSSITGRSATQAATDTGGRWERVGDGEYIYTFGTRLPAGYDRSVTHTVGVYANRNLNEFEFGISLADAVFHWVPDGSSRPAPRDVIRTKSCQRCHVDNFAFHGTTGRISMEVCVLCHTPQTIDPDTGNSVDMVEMTHKIHMGANLPSVRAGGKYQLIGFGNTVWDYSEVVFPTDVRNCNVCHETDTGATQASRALTAPTRVACGSCHDNVDFATGRGHVNLPQPNDSQCARCHIPAGELEFDASIVGSHTLPYNSKMLTGFDWEILRVEDGVAGRRPTITFKIQDKDGNPLTPAQFNRIFAVLAGPTTDYSMKFAGATTSGYVGEDLSRATGSGGIYTYTFQTMIPANARGTYSISLEGRRVETIYAGTQKQQTVQYGPKRNAIVFFSVDGSPVTARRKIVTIEKCNACHVRLSLHGENRVDTIEHCVVCHNPVETDVARRPAAAGKPQSVDFRQMIHNIHGGKWIKTSFGVEDYIIYGFGGRPYNYSNVVYPGRLASCDACHVNNSQNLPLPQTAMKVTNPRGLIDPVGPQAASCLSCHQSLDAASHALVNTSALGESCGACHGANSEFSVRKVHALASSPAPR